MSKVKHVLGISGGKDSAALAIYINSKHPDIDMVYYSCDTGRELDETYKLIDQLEIELGKGIKILDSVDFKSANKKNPFDFFLANYGGYLPSNTARWCTKDMKLKPFEDYVGDTPTVSYVGIRGDEDREGYISTKENIQSIFPFRKNIWSVDVIKKAFSQPELSLMKERYSNHLKNKAKLKAVYRLLDKKTSASKPLNKLVDELLDIDIKAFNKVIFDFLKTTDSPVGQLKKFSLIDNDDILVRNDIFQIIEDSNVELPGYYKPIEYTVDGEKGRYYRSRSGCFFCFFQQKIEWVWLLEQHPELFKEALKYEKDGYNWVQGESLEELAKPERVINIKREHLKRMKKKYLNLRTGSSWQDEVLGIDKKKSIDDPSWLDDLIDAEGDGCASCFI
jgi:3'-phosphoadenosine 5'-phosphosulfate sulfotransferase (PAPS reductase)/FAD synthetase